MYIYFLMRRFTCWWSESNWGRQ